MGEEDNFQKEKPKDAKEKYGEDCNSYSAKEAGLENGIKRDRKITDILCLFIFFAFIIAMGVCTVYANKNG